MGRYVGAVCRLCRAEGAQLFLKGTQCASINVPLLKEETLRVFVGKKEPKVSDYGVALREKQKVKRMYGLSEKQFRRTFDTADSKKGKTGDNLLIFLERRLDNVVLRSNFAASRFQARQLVNHGHFLVNGRKVDIPSYQIREGDVIEAREKSRNLGAIRESLKNLSKKVVPGWIDIDENDVKAKVLAMPVREDIQIDANEQLIVELYSK